MKASVTLTLLEAEKLAFEALVASNTSEKNARSTALALVAAEADGQKGHGLSRVSSYSAQSRSGKVNGHANPQLDQVAHAALRIDADLGFCYPAVDLAVNKLDVLTRETGIACASIFRSHHFGQAGAHAERLAQRGLVALIFGNSPKGIAFWGGKSAMMGTNPIAFAAPLPEGPPLVIDLALSVAARGKIMAAKKAGATSIPEGWALDAQGKPTTDPDAALQGSMLPIGDAKGAALALMVEIFAAALTGSNFGFEASSLFVGEGDPPNLGQTIIALDANTLSGGTFMQRMQTLLDAIESEEGARLPGASRLTNRQTAAEKGVTIPAATHAEILHIIGENN